MMTSSSDCLLDTETATEMYSDALFKFPFYFLFRIDEVIELVQCTASIVELLMADSLKLSDYCSFLIEFVVLESRWMMKELTHYHVIISTRTKCENICRI